MRIRLASLAALAAALVALAPHLLSAPAEPPAPSRPRLVLFVSVDQMRFDFLTRFGPLFKGGFRTLLDRGAVFSNAKYRHANTETGPGHAVLLSGRSPLHSGIVANEWFDAALARVVNVVEDPTVSAVGAPGRGASPAHFIGFTVGDMLKRRDPGARVVGVSVKDRSAILMAGPRADAAYWFDFHTGAIVTSTHYMKSAPPWLERINERRLADSLGRRAWTRLLPDEGLYRKHAGEDAIEGEWDRVHTTFPHVARGTPPSFEFYEDFRRTPFADEMVLEMALEAMAAHEMGADEVTDILAVGFSAADSIGHTYGPDSQEVMDHFLRLDLILGRLIEEAERRVGPDRVLVGLGADHGALPLVEVLQARGVPARRVHPRDLETAVAAAMDARFGSGHGLVARYMAPDFYLDLAAIERRGLGRRQVEQVVEKALAGTGLVEKVYTHAQMIGDPPKGDALFPLVRRSFFQPRSPHLSVVLKPYIYMGFRPGGTGHGTAHEYDRHVPVAFLGRGIVPGRYERACGPEDIAPTLAALLGLDYPLQDAERVLAEMLRSD
ncbi:MAG TPA: alkaline phosphatase family protein [Vicinamibacteria bacterium]|nr:alkaline phosphatase family protein [Vicinamibacteria bacterium]